MSTPANNTNNKNKNKNKTRKMGPTLKSLARDVCDSITADDDHPMAIFALGGEVHIKQSQSCDASKKALDATAQSPGEQKDTSDPIIIRWDPPNEPTAALRRTSFPLTSDAEKQGFKQLLEDTQPATFGRGAEEVLDETYRKAQKLPETAFSTNLCPYKLGIIDTVRQVLLPNVKTAEGTRFIRAELYNINVYSGPSGKFKAHVDTPRSSLQIGSLVVCLPTKHEGGELAVRHAGRSHTFDWGSNSEKPLIQWAAFYSDCEHEVFEVKSGHRVTMTYNLYATHGGSLASQISVFNPTSLPLYSKIKALVASKRFQHKDRIIGFYSTHAYPHTAGKKHTNLPFCLKGIDMALYETFRSLGLGVHLCSVMEAQERRHRSASDLRTDGARFSDGEEAESSEEDSDDGQSWDDPSTKKHVKGMSPVYTTDSMMYDNIDIYQEGLGDNTVDPERIVWINQNNGLEELQIAYITYGNQPSLGKVYSHFAMVVEIPAGSIAA